MVEVVTTDEFAAWYESLSDAHGESVFQAVVRLEQFGTQLPFPHSSALMGSKYALRELRVKAQGAQIRIAYAFDPTRNAVLILGGAKGGRRSLLRVAHSPVREALGAVPERARRDAMKRWQDIKARGGRISAERMAAIEADVAAEVSTFRALREELGLTQAELAKLANMTQSEVSRFEQREDHRISNLREMVEALGGKLEVTAVIGDRRVRLDVSNPPSTERTAPR